MNKKNLIYRYSNLLIQYRLWIISIIAIITFLFASQITKLKIDMNIDRWAPQAHLYVKTTKVLEQVFGGRNFTLIGIIPKEGDIFQPFVLEKIQHIQEGIENLPEAIKHNVVSLAARKVKNIKGTREGMEVHPLMDAIPQTPEEIDRLKANVNANPIYIDALVSRDGKAAAVIADFNIDKNNPSYSLLYKSIRGVVDKERDERVEIYMGGLPIILAWVEYYMMKMSIYFVVALLVIILIQYWSFKSIQGMILPITTALLSVIWGLGLMSLMNINLDAMNTSTPILIMAVAAGHSIQILKRYYEEYNQLQGSSVTATSREISHAAIVNALVAVGPVMITAGLIAAISFFSLATTGISAVKHFGIFAGCGILAALVLEMTFIPALRSILPAPKLRERERERRFGILDRFLTALSNNLVGGRAPWILGIGTAVILVMFMGFLKIDTDCSWKRYNNENTEVRKDDDRLNKAFGGTNSIFYLIEGSSQDSIKNPDVLKGMDALQNFLSSQVQVGKTQSIVDLIKRMNKAMHADDPRYDTIPDDRDLISQYLFLYSISGDPQDLENFVDNDYQKAAIWVFVKEDSIAYADELYKKSREIIDRNFPPGIKVQMGGSLPQTIAINEAVTQSKYKNMAQMVLAVYLLSCLVLRSFVGGLFVITPLITVIMANFGLMGWFGIPLDMATATTAAMAIGIGADYEIYLLFRFREELRRTHDVRQATHNSLLTSGKAILFVGMSIAGGYATLLTIRYAFYTRLSIMVVATMVVSALSAILFLRAMMITFKPKFIFGEESEALFNNLFLAENKEKALN